jgi:type IV secretion system protein VirD4
MASLCGFRLFLMAFPWSLIVPLIILARRQGHWWSWAHGTARWATASDLKGMVNASEGLILGRLESPPPSVWAGIRALFSRRSSLEACQTFLQALRRKPSNDMVRLSKACHIAVFAPPGMGKGVSVVIPYLLTCEDSMVVVDFKGELAKETAEFRKRKFGHRIVYLDPFKVATPSPDSFNALDWIDKDSETAIDECRDLAEALVIRTGQEKDPHFTDAAEIWIASMIALVVAKGDPGDRSLQTVRALLTDPTKIDVAIKMMSASSEWGGMLKRLGGQLSQFKDKELGSVLTTTNRMLRFLDTMLVAASTSISSFDPGELNTGKMTIYLILPPDHMRSQSALLRMWIGAFMRAVVKGGLKERKVQFVVDEASSLGQMDLIDDALDKYRGYGLRLLLVYQSKGQLKKVCKEGQDQTLLSNVTQVFFGVNDNETAEYVSTRLGEATISVASGGTSTGSSRQASDTDANRTYGSSSNANDNWNQVARKLLKPEEVMALDPRTAITFAPGLPPIATRLLRYFEEDLGKKSRWPAIWSAVRAVVGSVVVFF